MSKQFYFKQFRLAYKNSSIQTIKFSISTKFSSIWPIGPYQVLPLRARVNLGAMAMKRNSSLPKSPE